MQAARVRQRQATLSPATLLTMVALGLLATGFAFAAAGLEKATALLLGFLFIVPALLNLPLAVVLWAPFSFLPPLAFIGAVPTAAAAVVLFAWIPTLQARLGPTRTLLRLHAGRITLALLLLVWVTLSLSWAREPESGLESLWQWWLPGVAFVIAVTTVATRRQARLFVLALVVGAVLSALVGVLSESLSSSASSLELASEDRTRLGSILDDPNYVAAGMIAAVVLATGLLRARHPIANAWLVAAMGLLTVSFAATESRGALVAAGVAAVAAILFFKGRRAHVLVFLAVLTGVAAIWFSVNPNAWERISEFDSTGTGRTALWQVAWRMTEDHPVAGVGLNNFIEESSRYTREPGKLEAVNLIVEQPHVVHNVYLQFLAETGVIGLALFLALLISSLQAAWRAGREFDRRQDREMAVLARACFVALIAFAAASFFISDGNDVRFWLLLSLGPIMLGVALNTAPPPAPAGRPRRRRLGHHRRLQPFAQLGRVRPHI